MNEYLKSTDVIDWQHPAVRALAAELAAATPLETAQRTYEWVRDQIKHSYDYHLNPITCSASEVLAAGTGYCYAKSHLLAALLRANGIPAGLCYQRLTGYENGQFCLHGLNAVFLPDFGWYRIDPRGNKPTVDAQFAPPVERLAFRLEADGERDLPGVYADPLPQVVAALRSHATWDALAADLPDVAEPLSG